MIDFLSLDSESFEETKELNLEDALPSTLSRNAAMEAQTQINTSSLVAAAYYPDWSADTIPPESLDYSKFDILYFGAHRSSRVCNHVVVTSPL